MSIKIVDDFFNKLSDDIHKKYFPDVQFYRDNNHLTEAKYAIELFNNGALTYGRLISKLLKYCNDTKENIHSIVSQYIESFGDYKYQLDK